MNEKQNQVIKQYHTTRRKLIRLTSQLDYCGFGKLISIEKEVDKFLNEIEKDKRIKSL